MIDLHIIGQTIRHSSPNIAADSYNYIEVQCWFAGTEWDNLSKWLHFKQGDTEYTLELDENNRITAEQGLNLTVGEWEIFLTGNGANERITTIPIIINVYESGLINAPLGAMPMTVAEQVAKKADAALTFAREVSDMAAAGEFDGKSFEIVDYYESLAELEAAVPEPPPGALYGVGTAPPLDIYGWSPARQEWVNNGKLQGAQGEQGKAGPYYCPSVDSSGNLSWSNNGGLENPSPVNIRGPQGAQGEQGEDGKGPYEFAREGGYTGTEKTLMEALVMVPEHRTRHEAGGADPITVSTGMIAAKAVTRAKLANDALYSPISNISGNYTISATDLGKTLVLNSGSTALEVVFNDSSLSAIPVGGEIAFVRWMTGECILKFSGSMVVVTGVDGFVKAADTSELRITTPIYNTFALKRMSSTGIMVVGNVEVVS